MHSARCTAKRRRRCESLYVLHLNLQAEAQHAERRDGRSTPPRGDARLDAGEQMRERCARAVGLGLQLRLDGAIVLAQLCVRLEDALRERAAAGHERRQEGVRARHAVDLRDGCGRWLAAVLRRARDEVSAGL